VNNHAAKALSLTFISLTLLFLTDCRTVRENRSGVSGPNVAEVNKIPYENNYYEFEAVPGNLRFDPEKYDREFVLYVLNTYSKDSFYIVYNSKRNVKTKQDFMQWADTGSKLKLLDSISTIVHECNHILNARLIFTILKQNNIDPPYRLFSRQRNRSLLPRLYQTA